MDETMKNAIQEYQCPGCVNGSDFKCYQSGDSSACSKHCPGTIVSTVGKIFLGMPKGFSRLGTSNLEIMIYKTFESSEWISDKWNVPVWKYLDKNGHTLIRGLSPRLNESFLNIFLEDCIDKIHCIEITQDDVNYMD